MPHVLFVCLHNAGRSQMSKALFDRAAAGRHTSDSAGSAADPDGHVHPQVVQVMDELGIDLSDRQPQRLSASSPGRPTSSSPWAAATAALTSPASAISTGICPTRKANPSRPCGRSATTSPNASTG
jgi:hypothetical protein